VGGPVRDAFLGRATNDLDFTTSANPDQILEVLKGRVDAQWDVGREFGTIGARIGEDTVEITTYRADAYDAESRKPVVAFGKSLEDDLFRRDFTVNSMALRLPEGVFVDPFNGLTDLIDGVIRTPGKPEDSFSDDPLRIMRAARFASQLGFMVHEDTFRAMKAMAKDLDVCALAMCQLNRQSEQRKKGSTPMLSDLRGSGSLEQDSDTIFFINRAQEDDDLGSDRIADQVERDPGAGDQRTAHVEDRARSKPEEVAPGRRIQKRNARLEQGTERPHEQHEE
jgi:hypothetical protein